MAKRGFEFKPVMMSLYLDGIRFTRSDRTGKTDSLSAYFAHTFKSKRRHPLAVLRKSQLCRCGCRGWCSQYPIMLALQWSFQALLDGKMPKEDHRGQPFLDNDWRQAKAGEVIHRGALVQIKGDLIEQGVTFGLRGLASHYNPCMMCQCSLDSMCCYEGVTLDHDDWGEMGGDAYEFACQRCERSVLIDPEAKRIMARGRNMTYHIPSTTYVR